MNFFLMGLIPFILLLTLNTKMLLKSLNTGDFESFSRLCEPEMTSFQPETVGNLVQGVDFYKFYFDHHKR